jgi:uncharacterized phiE125 gp8 family phage protein
MKVSIVTNPIEEPITLNEAKEFLKVENEDDDGLILAQIKAATEYCQDYQGRKYLTQTWKMFLDEWPDEDYIELPFPPLRSITSIKYTDTSTVPVVTTMSTSDYDYDTVSEPGRIVLGYGETWPTVTLHPTNPIEIQFVCGYGTPDDVPEYTKNAIKLVLDELYELREVVVQGTFNRLDLTDRLLQMNRTFHY